MPFPNKLSKKEKLFINGDDNGDSNNNNNDDNVDRGNARCNLWRSVLFG